MRFSTYTGYRIFDYGSSYSYESPVTHVFDIHSLFNVTDEKDNFPTKEELWAKAEELIRQEDGPAFSYLKNLMPYRIEKKILELFSKELMRIAGKWTGSFEKSERIVSKVIQYHEYAIRDYLEVRNERFVFYTGFYSFTHSPLSLASSYNPLRCHSIDFDESLMEAKLSQAISELLYKPKVIELNIDSEEAVSYRSEGKIESNLDWEEFIRIILSRMRIFVKREFFERATYKNKECSGESSLFYSTITFMQEKASL